MEKEVTIYDIAKRLNYSPATVSRALNDHPAIRLDTKDTIVSMAREMGYRSNTFASNLRRQRTNTIGVIVPQLNSSFQATVLAGIERIANEASFNLIISQSLESVKKEVANARTMFNSRVDGLLVSVVYNNDSFEHFEPFIRRKIPVLFFDRVLAHKQCTSITIDNMQAGYEATAHLIEQGCRRIMHVTGNTRSNVYADRMRGYQQALQQHNLPVDESLVITNDLTAQAGVDVASHIQGMSHRPDGLFITNDLCAASSIVALRKAGISVPDDIAVVGFNDESVAQVVEPSLTTVRYAGDIMGEVAAKSLINHLNGNQDILTTNRIILRSELIVRDSSIRSRTL